MSPVDANKSKDASKSPKTKDKKSPKASTSPKVSARAKSPNTKDKAIASKDVTPVPAPVVPPKKIEALPLPAVVLLVDPSLQSLPWEGASFLEAYFGGKVSRDFSVHMLGHRLSSLQGPAVYSGSGNERGLVVTAPNMKVLTDPLYDDNTCY